MSLRRISRRTVAAVAVAATAAVGAVALGGGTAGATASTIVTVSKLSIHRLPALTANQVITVTGTGFDESVISGVTIGGCTTDPTYIVQSPTTLLLKTSDDCAVGTAKVVTVTDTSSNTAATTPATAAMALDFVAAPTIATATATVRPVKTDASATVSYANQVTSGSTKGGSVVRVTSGTTGFVSSAAFPPAMALDGVAMTKVTLVGTSGSAGNYLTGVLGAHAADAAPVLKVTSNGVSKNFVYGAGGGSAVDQTFDFAYAGTTISISPSFGPINGGTALKITGTFAAASPTVTVGGTACTVTAHTLTAVTCTVPAVTTAAPATVQVVSGGLTSIISSGSTFTYVSQ